MPFVGHKGPPLPESDWLTPGEFESPAVNETSTQRAKRIQQRNARWNRIAARWFAEAVAAWPKAMCVADVLEVSEPHVSAMCSGEKTIPFRGLVPVFRDREAFIASVRPICEAHGLSVPAPIQTVNAEQVQETTTAVVRRTIALWKMVRREVADELGADENAVEQALAAKK